MPSRATPHSAISASVCSIDVSLCVATSRFGRDLPLTTASRRRIVLIASL
jgi:hypothetical protein